uniref:Ketosynthase family 3 (KS3) domain-containing protein n=1 Tax=Alexandrium monilatum TaxID=311494 RepID=A0A7S4R6G5_9DINO
MAIVAASKKVDLDISKDNVPPEVLGLRISEALSVKGFCVLAPDIDERRLETVQADIDALDKQGCFVQPPEPILEGLLSMAGSARIAEIELPEGEDPDEGSEGASVRYFDKLMTEMSLTVAPYLPNLQMEVKSRTTGIIHEAGMPPSEGPELDEDTCAKWVTVFAHHAIMCIWALGPGQGTLELQPFDDESNGYAVPMKPGTFVLLRADALSHRFSASGKAYCLTCWLQRDSRASKHRDNTTLEITPCCRALEDWADEKIKEYKESFPDEQARINLPRHWELVMNHTNFVGQHISVRTCSIKQVAAFDPNAWAGSFVPGIDMMSEIPLMRFSLDQHYDANPEAWNWNKINVRHGSFIEGVELFDNALFRISRAEAAGMDPGHRMTMETGYEALVRDGYKISTIMNTRGGVYVANPPPSEWGMAEKDCISSGVCGGGGSIACGRFSFVHGLKGPCISVDVEAASSLVAANFCATNLSRTGKWEPIPYGLVQSWNLMLHPIFLVHASAGGRTCPAGRCFCFDASANGFVRGEGAISLVLKAMTSVVDGQVVVNDGSFLGALAASAVNQSGKRAHITAPDGTAMQEVVYEAVRQAEISPLDVDAVELASDAVVLFDALEVAATAKAYRPEGMPGVQETCPISILCAKSNFGNQLEAVGLCTLLRTLLGMHWGVHFSEQHLRLLNPHIDIEVCNRPAYISSEAMEFRMASSYVGVTNRSVAGTNCHCILWGQVSDSECSILPEPTFKRDKIIFWPEGGGQLEDDSIARRGYQIVGTFNGWEPENMSSDGGGIYSATVVMGENRWERFQILLDSDARRVLYPSYDRLTPSTKGAPVAGPDEVFHSDSWTIDARPYLMEENAIVSSGSTGLLDRQDEGRPGDRFKVRLAVKGKWRMVDWENLDQDQAEPSTSVPPGTYQISGSWNHGELQSMTADPAMPGLFTAEVKLLTGGVSMFQIIRNRDWGQAIYPDVPGADSTSPVLGPEEQLGCSWAIEGKVGDVFQVSFQRAIEGGGDEQKVTWAYVRNEELTKPEWDIFRRTLFFVVGTWDEQTSIHRMHWTGEYYQFYVQLGARAKESFKIFQHGSRLKCIYPGTPDANPFEKHELRGPDNLSAGLMWTIGSHQSDDAEPGKRYEIRLRVNEDDSTPEKLDWIPMRGLEGLEDAKGRGFLVAGM